MSNTENLIVETEVWKDVIGYEGYYQVSNLGRIRSLMHRGSKRKKPYIMHPHVQKNGYAYACLSKDKIPRVVRFHRIVASAFIPNPNKFPYINHIDENKTNNRADNLEWCTAKYNSNYGNIRERIISPQRKPVGKYDKKGNLLRTYIGVNEAARIEGISAGNICMVCKGQRNETGGHVWRYIDE